MSSSFTRSGVEVEVCEVVESEWRRLRLQRLLKFIVLLVENIKRVIILLSLSCRFVSLIHVF